MDRDLKATLKRIEDKLDVLLEDAGLEPGGPRCPHCGSFEVEPTPDFERPHRLTCHACRKSTTPEQEAVNG